MRVRLTTILAAVALVAAAAPAGAQDHVWVRASGPDGGDCRAIAYGPAGTPRVLAAFSRGIHLSTNGGESWSLAAGGAYLAYEICFQPGSSQIVYAATNGGGLRRSTDGGATWAPASSPDGYLFSVAIDPADPQRMYAGASSKGVYYTTNGGGIWTRSEDPDIQTRTPVALMVDPADGQHVIAGAFGGVWVSTDGGVSWEAAASGLGSIDVRDLAASPADARIIYAATAGGIYKTTDFCASWTPASSGLTEPSVNDVAIDPQQPDVAYAATKAGVYRSLDAGANWQKWSAGMERQDHAQAVAVDPSDSLNLLAGTGGSIFRSADGGANWTMSARGVVGMRSQALAAGFGSAGGVVVGCGTGIYGAGVYSSTDWGLSWGFIGIGNEYVYSVAAVDEAGAVIGCSDSGIFRTIDGGATWVKTGAAGRCYGLCADAFDPLRLYAASSSSGVWRSTDAGANWVQCNNGLGYVFARSLAVDRTSGTLYVGLDATGSWSGVYRSTDRGATWLAAESGVQGRRIWALAVGADGAVYAAAYPSGLYKSTDGGANFAAVGAGLASYALALAADPVNGRIYAGLADGVYVSDDQGAHFTKLSGFSGYVLALLVDPSNHNFLYAGSDGDRVWRCTFKAECAAPAQARAMPDGQLVRLSNVIVAGVFGGRFWVEGSDRSSGIAVIWDMPVQEGQVVTVTGTLQTVDGERRIAAISVI